MGEASGPVAGCNEQRGYGVVLRRGVVGHAGMEREQHGDRELSRWLCGGEPVGFLVGLDVGLDVQRFHGRDVGRAPERRCGHRLRHGGVPCRWHTLPGWCGYRQVRRRLVGADDRTDVRPVGERHHIDDAGERDHGRWFRGLLVEAWLRRGPSDGARRRLRRCRWRQRRADRRCGVVGCGVEGRRR